MPAHILSNGHLSNPQKQYTIALNKHALRRMTLSDSDGTSYSVYHIYPRLSDWPGRQFPDSVNPRTHNEQCLATSVAADIERTILDAPTAFKFSNRGGLLLVDTLRFSPQEGAIKVTLQDEEIHGLADGATTDAVIAKLQQELNGNGDCLNEARLHVEVIVGLADRELITQIVTGRNTSRPVKGWTISDFKGQFDWIKTALDDTPFRDRIGYEENAGKPVKVLSIISYLTCFHPSFDDELVKGMRKAPTIAYCSAGLMNERLASPELAEGYLALKPLLLSILKLRDYLEAHFEDAYTEFMPNRLGQRQGVKRKKKPVELPLTLMKTNYSIPAGFIYPLLASFRALVRFQRKEGVLTASWKTEPEAFFKTYGGSMVATLFGQADLFAGNPNTAGKSKAVYTSLHDQVRLMLEDK